MSGKRPQKQFKLQAYFRKKVAKRTDDVTEGSSKSGETVTPANTNNPTTSDAATAEEVIEIREEDSPPTGASERSPHGPAGHAGDESGGKTVGGKDASLGTDTATPGGTGPTGTAVIQPRERACEESATHDACNAECCSVREAPYQPKDNAVLQSTRKRVGKKDEYRSFQGQWYDRFTWLHLCVTRKRVFCFTCLSALKAKQISGNTQVEESFTKKGFDNWKKAISAFHQHQTSDLHKEAVFKKMQAGHGVDQLLEHHGKKLNSVRRQMLLTQLDCVRYLLRQGLALRGHEDVEGNLRQLLKLLGKDNKDVTDWLENQDYLSPVIINEMIQLIGHSVLRDLLTNIREAGMYAIMADETCDLSNKEQLSVCIRWVDADFAIHEDLIGFVHVVHTDAETLTKALKDVLLRCSLPLSQCRGQGYDGAANMMGRLRGVASRLREDEPAAIHVHCWAHCLNLCLQEASKSSHVIRDSLYLVGEISKLIRNSPKRSAIFQQLKDQVSPEAPGLRPLCPTRWTVRTGAILGILSNYDVLMDTMAQINEESHDEFGTRARGILSQLEKFHTFFGLKLSELIFTNTEELSMLLQNKRTTLDEASSAATVLTRYLQHQREEETFTRFYEGVRESCRRVIGAEPCLPRVRALPRRIDDGGAAHRYATPDDYYRHLYYEAIDIVIGEMDRRFSQDTFQIPQEIERTLLSAANWDGTGPQVELSKQVAQLYQRDIDLQRLQRQLCMLPELIDVAKKTPGLHQGLKKVTKVQTIVDIIQEAPGAKQMFCEVAQLSRILMTVPVSTATAERSFSALRRLKTYLRTTMTQQRFNNVALAHCHKEKLDKVNMKLVAKEFASANDRRVRFFGKFE